MIEPCLSPSHNDRIFTENSNLLVIEELNIYLLGHEKMRAALRPWNFRFSVDVPEQRARSFIRPPTGLSLPISVTLAQAAWLRNGSRARAKRRLRHLNFADCCKNCLRLLHSSVINHYLFSLPFVGTCLPPHCAGPAFLLRICVYNSLILHQRM